MILFLGEHHGCQFKYNKHTPKSKIMRTFWSVLLLFCSIRNIHSNQKEVNKIGKLSNKGEIDTP